MNEEEQLAAAIRASLKETLHNQEKVVSKITL
jgi:hypothetical protein